MAYLQVADNQINLRAGDMTVGTGAAMDIRVIGDESATAVAIVTVKGDGSVSVRRGYESAAVKVNGVMLGVEPTPLIHGDKVEVAGQELKFGDDKKGGSTQFISGADLAELARQRSALAGKGGVPTGTTGGRLVSLTDGREYTIPTNGLNLGRDASCDVVIASGEVSRNHGEISSGPEGYYVIDTSTNGVWVNGKRVEGTQTLGRGDVIRMGPEEFRFYADKAQAVAAAAAATSPVMPTPAAVAAIVAPPPAAAAPPPPPPPPPPVAAKPAPAPPVPTRPPVAPVPAAAVPAARPTLAVLDVAGARREITGPLTHVGRGAHNDIQIKDDSVSDTHAKIQRRDDGWYLADAGSTNGTFLDGKRIKAERRIDDDAAITFGTVKATFRPGATEAPAGGTRVLSGKAVAEMVSQITGKDASGAQGMGSFATASAKAPDPARANQVMSKTVWIVAGIAAAAAAAAAAFYVSR